MYTSPLLTPDQVAASLGVNRRTVIDWLNAGKLPGVRLGKLWRIDPEALAEWLRARSTGDQQPRHAS